MKTHPTPHVSSCDEDIIVDFHEMISLLMGKDLAARQEFRNDVFKRAAEIRQNPGKSGAANHRNSKIIQFPMRYHCSA